MVFLFTILLSSPWKYFRVNEKIWFLGFDDMVSELKSNSRFINLFTKTAHHKNCLMAYLIQNAYEQGPDAATWTRNSAYQVYFNNKADVRWIRVLGDQLIGNHKLLARMFQIAMPWPHDCLLCDNRATTPEEQFIANSFFPTEENLTHFLIVYINERNIWKK